MIHIEVHAWRKTAEHFKSYYTIDPDFVLDDRDAAIRDAKKGNARAKKYVAYYTMELIKR